MSFGLFQTAGSAHFQGRTLNSQEELEILGVSMANSELGVTGLVSRELLLLMQGYDGLPHGRVLHDLVPCRCRILASTGTAMPAGLSGAEECGSKWWCQLCEAAVSLILSCPHAAALTDMCKAWIDKCFQAWARTDSAADVSK